MNAVPRPILSKPGLEGENITPLHRKMDKDQSCRVALSPMQQSPNPPGLRPGPRRGAHREGAAVTTRSAGNYRIRRPDNDHRQHGGLAS
jgi:hypothetical protein